MNLKDYQKAVIKARELRIERAKAKIAMLRPQESNLVRVDFVRKVVIR